MFQVEQNKIADQILAYCQANQIPTPAEIKWQPIPFSGEWGIALPFFPLAAQEARQGAKVNVAQRAQEIAEGVVAYLGTMLS